MNSMTSSKWLVLGCVNVGAKFVGRGPESLLDVVEHEEALNGETLMGFNIMLLRRL